MRRHHGLSGMFFSELLQIVLYSLIWLRHRWRRATASRRKASEAAAALRYLLT
jgi:hypothetical protein